MRQITKQLLLGCPFITQRRENTLIYWSYHHKYTWNIPQNTL